MGRFRNRLKVIRMRGLGAVSGRYDQGSPFRSRRQDPRVSDEMSFGSGYDGDEFFHQLHLSFTALQTAILRSFPIRMSSGSIATCAITPRSEAEFTTAWAHH